MKKVVASMALGMVSGMAGSYIMYREYKKGNLPKMLNNAMKETNKVVSKL